MNNFLDYANKIKDEMIQIRRDLHNHPEVGEDLPRTTAFVMGKLKEYGYEPTEICQSGIVTLAGSKKPGKTFLLRADMDALPIKEETNYEFKATNGNMHACGHDFHTTMLLGAAKLLKEHEDEINGTVKLVFQPDEEGFTGAKKMLKPEYCKTRKSMWQWQCMCIRERHPISCFTDWVPALPAVYDSALR